MGGKVSAAGLRQQPIGSGVLTGNHRFTTRMTQQQQDARRFVRCLQVLDLSLLLIHLLLKTVKHVLGVRCIAK